MTPCSDENDRWFTFGLAFVGGFGDASGLILANTFTGHVTGNLVLLAITFATHDVSGALRNIGAMATFLCGILLSALLAQGIGRRKRAPYLPTVICVEIVLICVASAAVSYGIPYAIPVFIVTVALALGLQNGALRSVGGTSIHTTYLTGMITNLITTATDKEFGEAVSQRRLVADPTLRLLSGIWISFVLGAATGATMVLRFHGRGIFGAAVVLTALLIRLSIRRRWGLQGRAS